MSISRRDAIKAGIAAAGVVCTCGIASAKVCPACEGSGTGNTECPLCKGTGKKNSFKCSSCKGKGFLKCNRCFGKGQI